MTVKMAILAYDGCFNTSICGPLDVFNIANTHHKVLHGKEAAPLFEWKILSADGRPIKTSTQLLFPVHGGLDELDKPDLCLIPGIDHTYAWEVVDRAKQLNQIIGPTIQSLHEKGTTIASNCSGAFVLAEVGLLHRREATTSWWLGRHFQQRYPSVKLRPNKLVTEDNHLLCSGAVTAYLHQCIRLIEKFAGTELANRCAKTLLINTQGVSQAPYIGINERIDKLDSVVHQAIVWMNEHLNEEIDIDALARELAVSSRTFNRRFHEATNQPPKQYLQKLRINEAKRLLATTTLSMEAITTRVGYNDVSSFRRLFKREVDLSPADYRRQFGAGQEENLHESAAVAYP